MICQACRQNEATIQYVEIVEGRKTSQWLCETCAARNGVAPQEVTDLAHGSLESIVGELLSGSAAAAPESGPESEGEAGAGAPVVCEVCGYRYDQLQKTGMLGCPACYASFRSRLLPMLRRYHGEVRHLGKLPRSRGPREALRKDVARLKLLLEQAVSEESYEQAASLRDEIRAKERQVGLMDRAADRDAPPGAGGGAAGGERRRDDDPDGGGRDAGDGGSSGGEPGGGPGGQA